MSSLPLRLSLPAILAAAATPVPAQNAATVYAKAKAAVVTVRTDAASGTGFVIGDGTLVLTCYHVVKDASWIRTDETGKSAVAVVGIDKASDVALLRLGKPRKSRLALRAGPAPQPGTKVYAIGTSLGFLDHTISEGIVSGRRRVGNVAYVQITAPVSHGNSGGPVLDEQARVVGMAAFVFDEGQSLNFAVSSHNLSSAVASIRAGERASMAAAARARRAEKVAASRPPAHSGGSATVLGRLGQATRATNIFTARSTVAKVMSRAEKDMYLVVRPSGDDKWVTVVMKDGRLGYVLANAVEVLAYEVTAEGAQATGKAPAPRASAAANDPDLLLTGLSISGFALQAKGAKYLAGGTSLESGVGNGEFVALAYASEGFDLSPVPAEQAKRGIKIEKYEDLQAGDRVYLWDAKKKAIGRAAIYLGRGEIAMADEKSGKVVLLPLDEELQKVTVAARRGAPRKPASEVPPPPNPVDGGKDAAGTKGQGASTETDGGENGYDIEGIAYASGDGPAVVASATHSSNLQEGMVVQGIRLPSRAEFTAVAGWSDVKRFLGANRPEEVILKGVKKDGSPFVMVATVAKASP